MVFFLFWGLAQCIQGGPLEFLTPPINGLIGTVTGVLKPTNRSDFNHPIYSRGFWCPPCIKGQLGVSLTVYYHAFYCVLQGSLGIKRPINTHEL